jgi:hypothetical protein
MPKITQEKISELLEQKPDGSLFHREQKDLEFKESFNLSGLAEYFRDFAGFANNSGGYIIFGVTNSPRRLKGLSKKSLDQFSKIDEERISGFINEHFAPYIDWEIDIIKLNKQLFGILYAYKSSIKPVICKKEDDKQTLKNGEIYYRYAGRTEVIQYSELANIIGNRIKENNDQWISKVKKIGEVGPSNVGILDTVSGTIEANQGTLLIDKDLIKEINFIKEGSFNEKKGAKTLKLIGSVQPIDAVEVAKVVKKRLIDEYLYSYKKLEKVIRREIPKIKINEIQKVIRENDLKNDLRYSSYNFRNKDQEDQFKKMGVLPKDIPSIYNEAAIQYIIKVLGQDS